LRGFRLGVYHVHDGQVASSKGLAIAGRRESNLDERFVVPFDIGVDQVYSADCERELLSAQNRLRFWSFAPELDGPIKAFNFDPAVPSPRIALERTPHSGREGKVGEGGRDWGTAGRLSSVRVLIFGTFRTRFGCGSNRWARNCQLWFWRFLIPSDTLRIFFTVLLSRAEVPTSTTNLQSTSARLSASGSGQLQAELRSTGTIRLFDAHALRPSQTTQSLSATPSARTLRGKMV